MPRETERITHTLCLPYFANVSDVFRIRFRRFCVKYGLNCRIAYQPFKVVNYFCLKSSSPDVLKSCIVYKFSCSRDSEQTYIGRTKRHFILRIKEHQKTASAIRSHCEHCPCFSIDSFSILRKCRTEYEASVVEAILISKNRPVLNNTLTNSGQSVFLKL